MSFELGEIVAGQYRLDDVLGRGGMGAVYRATHVGLAETVAVKLIQLPAGCSPELEGEFMKRFEREARVAFKLRHDNAVQVLDFGEDEGTPYLVMEHLDGQPLADLIQREPVEPRERTVRLGIELADVLVTMHGQSLVHRDLKPENVILIEREDGSERPVIVDFGLAYLADSETLGRMTQGGETVGTPAYISPEQGRGDPVIGPASDIYAFGCVLFEMATGDVPFPEGSPTEVVGKHMFVPPPSVEESMPEGASELPGGLAGLIEAMIRKEADERPTAEEVRERLEQILEGGGDWQRGRPQKFLKERSERAVDGGGSEGGVGRGHAGDPRAVVGVVGEVADEWHVSLGSAGFGCYAVDGSEGADLAMIVDVVFIPDAGAKDVERYEEIGPVLVGVDPSDLEASTRLLQTAAVDVVPQPVDGSALVSKVERVWRKVERGKGE